MTKQDKLDIEFINSAKMAGKPESVYYPEMERVVSNHHEQMITDPKNNGHRWMTYTNGGPKERVKKTGVDRNALIRNLYNFYFVDAPTLNNLFPSFLDHRKAQMYENSSLDRYKQYWTTYYSNHPISNKTIPSIYVSALEDALFEIIKEHELNYNTFKKIKSLLTGLFEYAKRERVIAVNPMIDINIPKKVCTAAKYVPDEDKYFSLEEYYAFMDELNADLLANPNTTDYYGIECLFKIGIRLGELAALGFSSIDFAKKRIHIHRHVVKSSIKGTNKYQYRVVDYTKGNSDSGIRFIPLDDHIIKLFEQVKRINSINGYDDSEFAFVDANGRTSMRSFSCRIEKYCKHIGIKPKSPHDIRRTFATHLKANNVEIRKIQKYLGHSSSKSTEDYIFMIDDDDTDSKEIATALANFNRIEYTSI